MDFAADSIHGVLFVEPGSIQNDALHLWDVLYPGERPTAFQLNPSTPALQSSASAERNGISVNIVTQVGRIELIMVGIPDTDAGVPTTVPRITNYETAMAVAVKQLQTLADSHQVTRVSTVLDLGKTVHPGSEVDEIHKIIGRDVFPAGMGDLIFQMNSRRQFDTIPSLTMNRLCTCSSGIAGVFNTQPGLTVPIPVATSPYVGVKLDINSDPQQRLTKSSVNEAIHEVGQEALRIGRHGLSVLQ